MVSPTRRIPLPKQDDRKLDGLAGAMDDARRQAASAGSDQIIRHQRAADSAASDATTEPIGNQKGATAISRAVLCFGSAVSANATDYATVALKAHDWEGSGKARTLGSFNTSSKDAAAFQPVAIKLDHTSVPAGWTLLLDVSKAGAGVSLPTALLIVEGVAK